MIKVWTDGTEAGLLDRSGRGSTFLYLPDAPLARAVSVTMPVRLASWDVPFGLAPIIEMNLPEGVLRERLRLAFAKATGTFGRSRALNGGDPPKGGQFFRCECFDDRPAPLELVNLRDEFEDFRGDGDVPDRVHAQYPFSPIYTRFPSQGNRSIHFYPFSPIWALHEGRREPARRCWGVPTTHDRVFICPQAMLMHGEPGAGGLTSKGRPSWPLRCRPPIPSCR